MNVADHVARIASRTPDHPAPLFEGKALTYGVLDACADALAATLEKQGVKRGARVALYLPNMPAPCAIWQCCVPGPSRCRSTPSSSPPRRAISSRTPARRSSSPPPNCCPRSIAPRVRRSNRWWSAKAIRPGCRRTKTGSMRWADTYGHRVYEGYGLTECSPFAACNHLSKHKFGSVGTAVRDFELRIVDDQDREAPRGQWDEIAIRGPGAMRGYWSRPEDTRQALRNGWLHSGDIGRMDDEGYVYSSTG